MQTNHISNQYQHVQTIKTLYNTNQKASKLISTSIQTKKPQNQTKKPQHVQTLYNTNQKASKPNFKPISTSSKN